MSRILISNKHKTSNRETIITIIRITFKSLIDRRKSYVFLQKETDTVH